MIKQFIVTFFLVAWVHLNSSRVSGQIVTAIEGFTTISEPLPQPSFQTVWTSGTASPPIVAYYLDGCREIAWQSGAKILAQYPFIFVIYSDGTAIFSRDTVVGGPPYYSSTLTSAQLLTVRDAITSIAAAPDANVPYLPFPIPVAYHKAALVDGSKRTQLKTCHLIVEAQGEQLATSGGLVASNGQCFADIAASEPDFFVRYRQAWQGILDLRSIFDTPQATEIENQQTDLVFTTFQGQYDYAADFVERRNRRLGLASSGDEITSSALRGTFANITSISSSQPCNH